MYVRRNGEQVVVQRCWECGISRDNRIAADDDIQIVMRLPPAEAWWRRAADKRRQLSA